MRFKIDENLHPEIADLLQKKGHDALTVWDEGLQGRPDADQASVCRLEHRALVTLDAGFTDIRNCPPQQFAGLVVLRVKDQSRRNILKVFPQIVNLLTSEPLSGQLWIENEHSVRIREERNEGNTP